MTFGLLREARRLRRCRGTHVAVCFAGGGAEAIRSSYGEDLAYRRQCDGDLGMRLSRSFAHSFSLGANAVVAVGTDCPALTHQTFADAFEATKHHDVVLGPATDGGYYLIGLRMLRADLFRNISWGTELVLEQTRRAARSLGLSVHLLDPLSDVDRPEDLAELNCILARRPRAPSISVVIPALNEEEYIGRAIRSAMTADQGEVEIIVVDGGSSDETVQVARACGATVLESARGRARQMNAGAAAACGDILLFLHADSYLPADFAACVHRTLAAPDTIAGAFALRIEPPSAAMRFYAATTNLRSRVAGLPYGDQAIFLTRAAFERVGGYPDLPIMEDLELVRRLRRLGHVRIANRTAGTSARRWHQGGVLRTSFVNQLLLLAHFAGFSPRKLFLWRESGIIRHAPLTATADTGKDRRMTCEQRATKQLLEAGI
jgi:rSAM/selenodomain-associated transferase 2/rSAM/selenodomain-associated transferase 1